MTKLITVDILKPLYGNFVYIREEIINRAIRQGAMLEVKIPKGKAIVDPSNWKKNGKRMERVFKRPNEPMVLWGGNVPLEIPEAPKNSQPTLL